MCHTIVKPKIIALCLLTVVHAAPSAKAGQSGFIYTFDSESDTNKITDISGNGLDVELAGESQCTPEAAKFGTAGLILGKNSTAATAAWSARLNKALFSQLNVEMHKLTLSVWIRPREKVSTLEIFRRVPASGKVGLFEFIYGSGCLQFRVGHENEIAKSAPSNRFPIPENEWTHLALSFDGGNVTFYVNGEVNNTVTMPEITSIDSTDSEPNASIAAFLKGPVGLEVDDFGMVNDAALSPEAISLIYNKGLKQYIEDIEK